MCIYPSWITTNWLEIIKVFGPVATAVIAFLALENWQRQDKAKREAEFLNALIEATHTYISEMDKPVTIVEYTKIGIVSYAPPGEQLDKEIKGAIAYIEKNGERATTRLSDALEISAPSMIKLRSLAAKGQVFGFKDYIKCQNAVIRLTWQFDRISAFGSLVGSPTWNWKNPEVLSLLEKIIAIDADDIRNNLKEDNVAVLEFARTTYKRIYG